MNLTLTIDGRSYRVLTDRPIDLAIPLDFDGPQPDAFGLPRASRAPYTSGSFIAEVAQGGSVNCDLVQLAPHGNGTHTETVGHIVVAPPPIARLQLAPLIPAALLTVEASVLYETDDSYAAGDGDDFVITAAAIEGAWDALGASPTWATALVLRRDGAHDISGAEWSGNNPTYLTHEAMRFIRSLGVQHLLVDLPSVDREDDHGLLSNHRVFWDIHGDEGRHAPLPHDHPAHGRTITEMICAPQDQPDTIAVLNLQIPRWRLDAAPSWPRLFLSEEL